MIELNKDNFKATVENSEKPLIIEYYADWCRPCKQMGPIFEELSQSLKDKYVFAKANFDLLSDEAVSHGIQNLPSFVIINHKKVINKITGLLSKEKLIAKIEEAFSPVNLSELSKEELSERLYEAISTGSIEEVKKLINAGVDLNSQFSATIPYYPIQVLLMGQLGQNGVELLKLLLDSGAKLSFDANISGKIYTVKLKDLANQTIQMLTQNIEYTKNLLQVIDEFEAKDNSKQLKKEIKCTEDHCSI